MPLHTNVTKAFNQIARRDAKNVERYRAELKYFHVPQRVILGMRADYVIVDEAFTTTAYDDPLLRQAALFGPEFLNQMIGMKATLQTTARTLQKAMTNGAKNADWTADYVREHYPPDTP